MGKRSLQATPDGIREADLALTKKAWSRERLEKEVECSRQPISNFFVGKPVDRKIFVQICQKLDLDLQRITDLTNAVKAELVTIEQQKTDDVDSLVRQVQQLASHKIRSEIGMMRMLRVNHMVHVDKIYVDLKVLEPVSDNCFFADCRNALQANNGSLDHQALSSRLDHLGLTQTDENPQPALEIVQQNPKLMLLGKPGSGKTTFLRSLTVQCVTEEPQLTDLKNFVAIFIILRSFAKDFAKELQDRERLVLIKAIQAELKSWRIYEPETIETLLNENRILLLLDGLDEVEEQFSGLVVDQIRQFCNYYHDNRIIVTCRTQQLKYRFDSTLKDMKIDDFRPEQVQKFIQRWFSFAAGLKEGERLAEQLINQLEQGKNERIRNLAVTPILLNLVCSVALSHQGNLPQSRAKLYREGIRDLLTKWDEFEGKETRQRSSCLTVDEKEDLLSHIAWSLFKDNNLVPQQDELEKLIQDYLNISRSEAEKILKAFELEHGLLVERDTSYWSFSHLTFHEYFVAKYVSNVLQSSEQIRNLAPYFLESRWQEVFLLTTELLEDCGTFLEVMSKQVEAVQIKNSRICEILKWIDQKSRLANLEIINCSENKLKIINAFVSKKDGISILIKQTNNPINHNELNNQSLLELRGFYFDLFNTYSLSNGFLLSPQVIEHWFLYKELAESFEEGIPYILILDQILYWLAACLPFSIQFFLGESFEHFGQAFGEVTETLKILKKLGLFFDELYEAILSFWAEMLNLQNKMPYNPTDNFKAAIDVWNNWFRNEENRNLIEKFKLLISDQRKIALEWSMNDEDKKALSQYYDANKLLVNCLNLAQSEENITIEVINKIKRNLLLPINENELFE